MDSFLEFVKPELLVLVPVLYFVGMGIKRSESIKNKMIPMILGVLGVALSVIWLVAHTEFQSYRDVLMGFFVSVTQGILVAGCSVYINQLLKQSSSDE
ncbi:MAG: phage holin family protein [Bacillota bacterium]|nr:phage holin family protein [Bacillota bacterium]